LTAGSRRASERPGERRGERGASSATNHAFPATVESWSGRPGRPAATRKTKEHFMKHWIALSAVALALGVASASARAQASPPPLPELTPQQSADVQQRVDAYRRDTEARVARGEITPDEADRLVQWREWQLAQQAAGLAPSAPRIAYDAPPPDYYDARPRQYAGAEPPYYGPYYRYPAPYYYGPGPYYYWGPTVCAGGFGHHFGARFCF